MSAEQHTCPMSRRAAIDLYFLEHRAKLIDLAAFLDRVERCAADGPDQDFRLAAFDRALAVLIDGQPDRARRVQLVFSDTSTEPIAQAGTKGAFGAPGGTS